MKQHTAIRSTGRTAACAAAYILGGFLLVTGSGCVVAPDQSHYAGGLVLVAPPAPREENVGLAPEPGYVWLSGYWNWVGGRYEWVQGHWAADRPGHHWVSQHWVREGDGWRSKPGRWIAG